MEIVRPKVFVAGKTAAQPFALTQDDLEADVRAAETSFGRPVVKPGVIAGALGVAGGARWWVIGILLSLGLTAFILGRAFGIF